MWWSRPSRALRAGRAAELGGEDHERLVEQAALLQVLEQAGDRLVDLPAQFGCGLALRPPWASQAPAPPAAVLDLDEPHAALHQPPGRQHCSPKAAGRGWSRP